MYNKSYLTIRLNKSRSIYLSGGEAIKTLLKKINLEKFCDIIIKKLSKVTQKIYLNYRKTTFYK